MTDPRIPDRAAVWKVLEEECGAYAYHCDVYAFSSQWPRCTEYRFCGALGWGGKVWWNAGRCYVTCYREDETPERLAMIERANRRLASLLARPVSEGSMGAGLDTETRRGD